uniref:DUF6273 domain-containing protein n=1 Tax=Eubacterium cellulosolvens TaxID=29322 RepID=UPI0012DE1CAC|nr:DUF6273 domain-containing protein [[Eubacterium] cellulosolvens]
MRIKMKRFLGILLTLTLVLGLMPGMSLTAYADGTTYNPASTYTGFGNLNTNNTELTISEVSGITWYVIANDSTTVTLLSKKSFGKQAFNSDQSKGNIYETSDIKTFVDGLTGEGRPLAGISSVISDLALIDTTTAQGLSETKRKGDRNGWWLRSPGGDNAAAFVNGGSGGVIPSTSVDQEFGVRPALKLDLSKVTFDSATNTFALLPTPYPLWVGGVQVTSANKNDVLGDADAGATVSYDADNNTLTLNGVNIAEGYNVPDYSYTSGIYYSGNNNLGIVLSTDSDNKVGVTGNVQIGIESSSNTTISGAGKLTVKGSGDYSVGIEAYALTIKDAEINVEGALNGIQTQKYGYGVNIISGKVNAIGQTETGINSGLRDENYQTSAVTIGENATVVAIGGNKAINYLKNAIAGTGWTDPEDNTSKTTVSINNEGQSIDTLKKMAFPELPASTVTTAPEANVLTFTGSAQKLVTAGVASNGEMQYAIGTNTTTAPTTGWSASIPTATNAGTYYVWYKAVGDEDHSDSKPACITVTISKPAEKPAPADEEKGEADFKPNAAAPDVKGVEQEAIKSQMEDLAKADDTKLKAGQVKDVTVGMETKAVAEKDVPKKAASAIKETAEGMIPAKDRESTKCDFLDIAVSKIVIVYDVKNGKKVKNESDSISANLTNLAQVIDIPVKYDLTGKFNPLIVRYHNGKAEAFRRLYAAPAKDALKDGTYYVEGTGKNAIVHIYTNRFSTYALLTSGTEEYPRLGDSVTVYRLYYGPTMEHFYTTSAYERRVLIDKYGWVDEGIAWKSPKAPTTDEEKKTIKPVYRLFNPFTTDHHYTKDANERKTLIDKYGWKDEGVAFYSNDKGDATVYRLWHPGLITGAHHFTTGKHEYDVLITRGWIGETEAFKVNAAS